MNIIEIIKVFVGMCIAILVGMLAGFLIGAIVKLVMAMAGAWAALTVYVLLMASWGIFCFTPTFSNIIMNILEAVLHPKIAFHNMMSKLQEWRFKYSVRTAGFTVCVI